MTMLAGQLLWGGSLSPSVCYGQPTPVLAASGWFLSDQAPRRCPFGVRVRLRHSKHSDECAYLGLGHFGALVILGF
jgi:hypothetical protein